MKKHNGITLIALVITIVVLLILAGVAIQTLTGSNGLLTKAGEAKILTEIGEIEEKVKLKTFGNQELLEGSLDAIGLNINENLINKYKDILYVKDSKLYLSFIANYPQIELYKNNKDIIEPLKDKLEITYDSIKAYNKVMNPYMNDEISSYSTRYFNDQSKKIILNEDGNNFLHLEFEKSIGDPYTSYAGQKVEAGKNYNDIIYINAKYRNNYFQNEENCEINRDIIRTMRGERRI